MKKVALKDLVVGKSYAEVSGNRYIAFSISEPPKSVKNADNETKWIVTAYRADNSTYEIMQTEGYEHYFDPIYEL